MKYTFQEDSPRSRKMCANLSQFVFLPNLCRTKYDIPTTPFFEKWLCFFFVYFHIRSEGDVQPIGLKKNKNIWFLKNSERRQAEYWVERVTK